jgi:hypothetical protein
VAGKLRRAFALPLGTLVLILVLLYVVAGILCPARAEHYRRRRFAIMSALAGR